MAAEVGFLCVRGSAADAPPRSPANGPPSTPAMARAAGLRVLRYALCYALRCALRWFPLQLPGVAQALLANAATSRARSMRPVPQQLRGFAWIVRASRPLMTAAA